MSRLWMLRLTCLLVTLLASGSMQQRIKGFVENDANTEEGNDFTVEVDPSGAVPPVTIFLVPMTFDQYDQLPESDKMVCENLRFSDIGLDRAEESDFDTTVKSREISISGSDNVVIAISVLDDPIREPNEVFVVYLNSSDPGVSFEKQCLRVKIREDEDDVANINVTIDGRTTVNEDVGQINYVRFARVGQTEHTIGVTLEVNRGDMRATENVDFTLSSGTLELRPEDSFVDLFITVVDDDFAEYTENISINARWRIEDGGQIFSQDIVITIIDNEIVELGFVNDTAISALEGENITLCVNHFTDYLNYQRFTDGIGITTTQGAAIVDKHFNKVSQSEVYEVPNCITLKMVDDDILEESRDFTVTFDIVPAFESIPQPVSTLYTKQPAMVTVVIRDNDGVPNKPIIIDFKLSDDKKNEIIASWTTPPHPLRPVDGYTIHFRVLVEDPEKEDVLRVMNFTVDGNVEEKTFEINDLEEKAVDIKICAVNEFGETCSDVGLVQITPAPLLPEESSLPVGALIGIIIGALVLALCCCLWIILLVICLWWCGERERKYFPADREQKFSKDYEKYRSKRDSSTVSGESISDDDFSDEKHNP